MAKDTVRTPEQIEARQRVEALFGDLLKPEPKQKKAKATNTAVAAIPAQRNPHLKVEQHEYFLVTQECTTCGAQHKYARTQLVRFSAPARKDNLAILLPTAIPEAIDTPSIVHHEYETTPFCPSCVSIAEGVDTTIARDIMPQRELFK